jgi:hypothetical protein
MAGFQIDERKFRSAMPPRASSAWEDLKWSGAFFGLISLSVVWLGAVIWMLLRALF